MVKKTGKSLARGGEGATVGGKDEGAGIGSGEWEGGRLLQLAGLQSAISPLLSAGFELEEVDFVDVTTGLAI